MTSTGWPSHYIEEYVDKAQVFQSQLLSIVSEGLLDAFSEPCPNCQGRGIVITHEID